MRAALSVVIPTLNAATALPACLGALIEGLEAGLIRELIISDGGSDDGTLQLADEAGAVIVQGAASRGRQLRHGAEISQGDWLLFVHADTILPAGWSGMIREHMTTEQPAHFRLSFDVSGLMPGLVAGWANLRSRLLGLPYGDQGLLISRADYDAVGGFRDMPLMEDVAMARALRGRLKSLPMTVRTSAAKYQRDGWLRRGARNLMLLLRYFAGADPARLAGRY
ncbi:PGL/p-HBAD biosynthesis glycosyltransferase/MT3031 [Roseovarius litorisediminis]|uniref:PGL/p-HBAD biosynthesis glycosyltransferase/MT3031 n=1 Tax=Roseovarius litorisediminis TaxID=1312363 RepID=A0A1Y5SEV6_9RHOB|nr:TIGR04283 family arsenosugar biosynthesis glycosyltransferase [Roseovarius litorisediminis]SLN38734.1 PGL/p-HBAD biosynthesis glycosyltransferase/MT3031 [Roseovarius litorisediminis]